MAYVPVPYPRHVKNPETGLTVTVKDHIEESNITGVEMQENGYPVGVEPPAPILTPAEAAKANYKPVPYPRWVRDSNYDLRLVNKASEESRITGVPVGEDGEPLSPIPTEAQIIAAGYPPESVPPIIAQATSQIPTIEKPEPPAAPEPPRVPDPLA